MARNCPNQTGAEELDFGIRGFLPNTLIDWEGVLAAEVFIGGCNYRCPFCQNVELVLRPSELEKLDWEAILKYITSSKRWIDGLVISGGEPTIASCLWRILEDCKKRSIPVKLDTNGSMPDVLEKAIKDNMVSYVALDLKTSFEKYADLLGAKDPNAIRRSIQLLLQSDIEYEFRTTVVPGLVEERDIDEICAWIRGGKVYYLQRFSPKKTLDEKFQLLPPTSEERMSKLAQLASQHITTKIRGDFGRL